MTLIGATTENPYFEVNSALLSRSQIYELRALEPATRCAALLERALGRPRARDRRPAGDRRRGARAARRRAPAATRAPRSAALERAVETARAGGAEVDLAIAEDALQRKAVTFDKQGDRHYDYASALIKSMRGLRPRRRDLLPGGDARGRRGPALHRPPDGDPRLRGHRQRRPAGAARSRPPPAQAVDRVGLPECALNLAQAAVYLALAPKSNALVQGRSSRRPRHVREHGAKLPPDYLRDAHYPGAKKLGRGEGYVYSHDEPGGVADQPLLPPEVAGRALLRADRPRLRGELGERLERRSTAGGRARLAVAAVDPAAVDPAPVHELGPAATKAPPREALRQPVESSLDARRCNESRSTNGTRSASGAHAC